MYPYVYIYILNMYVHMYAYSNRPCTTPTCPRDYFCLNIYLSGYLSLHLSVYPPI